APQHRRDIDRHPSTSPLHQRSLLPDRRGTRAIRTALHAAQACSTRGVAVTRPRTTQMLPHSAVRIAIANMLSPATVPPETAKAMSASQATAFRDVIAPAAVRPDAGSLRIRSA